jgi:hypothetical protein
MLDKKTLTQATRTLPTRPSFSGEHEPRMLNVNHHLAKHLRPPRPFDLIHKASTSNVGQHIAKHLRPPRPFDLIHKASTSNVGQHVAKRLRPPRPFHPLHKARTSNVDQHLTERLHGQTRRCWKIQSITNWRGLTLCLLVAYRLSFWLVHAQLLTLPTVITNPTIHLTMNKKLSHTMKLPTR